MLHSFLARLLPLGIWLAGTPVYGQVNPQVDPLPLPEPQAPDVPLDSESQPAQPPITDDTTPFAVSEIQVVGSTVFDSGTLAEWVTPYENRTVTLAELQTLADTINQAYLDAGYITTQVRIPEQVLADGIVTIEVLEGQLSDISVEGPPRYRDYVSSRLRQAGTSPLNQPQLEDQLQLLSSSGLFSDIQGQLFPGDELGESGLSVQVEEANPLSATVFMDNDSQASVGKVRVGGRASYRSAIVPGDTLSTAISITTTGGAETYALGYQLPLGPEETTLRLGFTYENFQITDATSPSFALGVRGDTRISEAQLRHPLIRTPREELALSLGFRHRDGQSVILNSITQPSVTTTLQFAQDYQARDGSGAWAARSQFNLGLDWLGATVNPDPQPDGQFLSWLGQLQRVQVLAPDNLLIVRADLQLSSDSLLGSDQFPIGGAQSVRGYPQNVRIGDNGFRFSLEDRIIVERDAEQAPLFQLAPFMDMGAVWFNNSATQPTQQNFLWGTGLGVIATPVENLEARLDVGFPLVTLTEATDSPSGPQVYFYVGYEF